MIRQRNATLCAVVLLALAFACAPCHAWLYDAGVAQHLGASAGGKRLAAPFTVESDCYATSVGAAVARGFGPADAGFDAYLTATWMGSPNTAIAKLPQPLVPLNTQYVYYYGMLNEPVLLRAGTTYYMVMIPSPPDLTCSVSWGAKAGTYYGWGSGDSGESWYKLSYPLCVRVDGYLAPEPASLAALALGLVGIGVRPLLRRRCGSRRGADRA